MGAGAAALALWRAEVAPLARFRPPEAPPPVFSSYLILCEGGEGAPPVWKLGDALTERVFLHGEGAAPGGSEAFARLLDEHCAWVFLVEASLLPGVTDTLGRVAERILGPGYRVHSARLAPARTEVEAEALAERLANPLLHDVRIHERSSFLADHSAGGARFPPPSPPAPPSGAAVDVSLDVSDAALEALAREGIRGPDGVPRGPLGLSLADLKAIRSRMGPTLRDAELETFAQTWSEHCRHRIFAAPLGEIREGIFRRYIQGATEEVLRRNRFSVQDFVLSVFSDNAGAVALDDDWLLCDKVETHNSPSALDPFGGALTGILGVNRDCLGFGLAARPVANRYGFCLPPEEDARPLWRDPARRLPLPSAATLCEGVIAGVGHGGNASGIPTLQGFVRRDPAWRGKPLVFCGTLGLAPRRLPGGRASHKKRARPGDLIVMAGGRVGADGIHGATFSSEALHAGSPSAAVQLGDPFEQKKLADALLRDLQAAGAYASITDNGAGGLASSVGEMARESGGAEVELSAVPLKHPDLAPWQIWISEAQERMTLAVPARADGRGCGRLSGP